MTNDDLEEKFYKESIFKTVLLFIITNILISSFIYIFHIRAQKEDLFISISEKSKTIGRSVTDILEKSIKEGIPLNKINEGAEYLNNRIKSAKELEYIVITDENGEVITKSDDIQIDNKKIKYKESLKGKFISFAKLQKSIDDELQPFKVYHYYDIPFRIIENEKLAGYVHIGISDRAVNSNIERIFYDIAIILLVSLIIGYEFLSYIFKNAVVHPMRDFNQALRRLVNRDFSQTTPHRTKDTFGILLHKLNEEIKRINDYYNNLKNKINSNYKKSEHFLFYEDSMRYIESKFVLIQNKLIENPIFPVVSNLRLVMFLVVFGEAVLIASIPSYALSFYLEEYGISKSMFSALPVIFNMVFTAIFIPITSIISYRIGFRKSFILGAAILGISYVFIFAFQTFLGLVIGRSLSAIGFSICYVNCQNYVAAYSTDETRIQSYAIFSIASGAGFICGAPIGGILVDTIGYHYIFLFSFFISTLNYFISKNYIVDLQEFTLTKVRATKKRPLTLLKLTKLSMPVIFSALPTRFLFSSVICFLYPLYLYSLGNSQSFIGRVIMLFGIITFIVAPQAPKYIKKIKNPALFAFLFSSIIAIPMMLDPIFKTTEFVVIQLMINTFCTILYISSFMAMLDKISVDESESYTKSSILSFYFIFERIGMILGPSITGLLLKNNDYSQTLFYIGFGLIACNFVFLAQIIVSSLKKK